MPVPYCLHRRVCQLCGCYVWLFRCLLLFLCPLCCVEDPDTERWDHTDTLMSQHMLITFRSLSDKGLKACEHSKDSQLMIPTSEPQVAFATSTEYDTFLSGTLPSCLLNLYSAPHICILILFATCLWRLPSHLLALATSGDNDPYSAAVLAC